MRLLADGREARWKAGRREIAHVRKGFSDVVVTTWYERGRKSMLERLPAELRAEVYSYLDYGTLLTLARTSKFFRNDAPEEALPGEQRATYVFYAESFPRNKERLACFGCLKLLPSSRFVEPQRTDDYRPFGSLELERVCFECAKKRDGGERSLLRRLLEWRNGVSRRISRMKPS